MSGTWIGGLLWPQGTRLSGPSVFSRWVSTDSNRDQPERGREEERETGRQGERKRGSAGERDVRAWDPPDIAWMAFGAPTKTSQQQAKPPEKGVFPLDHFNECRDDKAAYMKCVDAATGTDGVVVSERCSGLARMYLECRMRKGLMASQELGALGLPGNEGET